MISRWHENPRLQGDFYRDAYRKTLRWLYMSVLVIYFLLVAIIYFTLSQPKQYYYANTTDGLILPMPGQ